MGHSDLSPQDRRGLVIFPAESRKPPGKPTGEWWLVPAALILAGVMIAVAFAIR
jgi:hypothetical protein